ncbi:hypothetical protein ACKWTF_004908 [Chironomus riparius]
MDYTLLQFELAQYKVCEEGRERMEKSSNRIYSNGFKLNNCNYRLFGNLNSQYHATYNICLESERKLCSIVIILLSLLQTPLSLLISIKKIVEKELFVRSAQL